MTLLARVFLTFVLAAAVGAQAFAQTGQLPSRNDGAAKAAINEFVHATTDQSSPQFVPPEQRIATFDPRRRRGSTPPGTRAGSRPTPN